MMRCRGADIQALGKEILADLDFLAKLHHSAEVLSGTGSKNLIPQISPPEPQTRVGLQRDPV
jgi:hypothetical protein